MCPSDHECLNLCLLKELGLIEYDKVDVPVELMDTLHVVLPSMKDIEGEMNKCFFYSPLDL